MPKSVQPRPERRPRPEAEQAWRPPPRGRCPGVRGSITPSEARPPDLLEPPHTERRQSGIQRQKLQSRASFQLPHGSLNLSVTASRLWDKMTRSRGAQLDRSAAARRCGDPRSLLALRRRLQRRSVDVPAPLINDEPDPIQDKTPAAALSRPSAGGSIRICRSVKARSSQR